MNWLKILFDRTPGFWVAMILTAIIVVAMWGILL
jgi:hypothetical protein